MQWCFWEGSVVVIWVDSTHALHLVYPSKMRLILSLANPFDPAVTGSKLPQAYPRWSFPIMYRVLSDMIVESGYIEAG